MIAAIINVGTELLLGDTVNTNAAYLGKMLAQLEIHTMRVETVGDNAGRLQETFERNRKDHDLIIFSGGLGPTVDDITKEVVCKALGLELLPDQRALDEIKRRIGDKFSSNNYKQTLFPENATIFYNKNGTAPGMFYDAGDVKVVLLPGPPSELIPMCEQSLVPLLETMRSSTLTSRYLNVYGISESLLEDRLSAILSEQGIVTIGTYFNGEKVTLRLSTSDKNGEAALDRYEQNIRNELAELVITEGTLSIEELLVQTLQKANVLCTTAESCTGGMLSAKITSVSGASEVFHVGLVTYSNEEKIRLLDVKAETLQTFGAVSAETAEEMAIGAAKAAQDTIACAITGIAGPLSDGSTKAVGTVFISLWHKKEGFITKEFHFKGNRASIRRRAINQALVLLTKEALALTKE